MATIDDRVVSMSFESTKFQAGVSSTLSSLDKLNAALKNVGLNNGLENIEKSANKISFLGIGNAIDKLKAKFGHGFPEADQAFSDVEKSSGKVGFHPLTTALDKVRGMFGRGIPEAGDAFAGIEKASGQVQLRGLGQALDGIRTKFSVLQGAAAVALGNIAAMAAQRGASVVKSLSLQPVLDGFHEYETQMTAIQTILANTRASGAGLKDVQAALNNLNHYADKTIYNFTQMTKNIGTFTAAGVDLNTATESIKGIANLAAVSGSSAEQASTAMYQLSQAISAGRVSLQDWNSVVNAGMGGTVFQRALAQTAVAMGTLTDNAVKLEGPMKNVKINGESFRNSITAKPGEQSWLTSKVLTNTLKQFSGDLSDAQLKAQGFNDAQIKAIRAQAKVAVNAATQVKTFSALLDTTKEAIGSGWAQTWQIIFGDFGEAKTLFTNISNALNGFISTSSNARNKVLGDWKALGGRKILIEGLKDAFIALKSVVEPIHDAFREIFPAKTGQQLLDLTTRFRDFMASLKIGPETAESLKRTFKGFFAVLDIGKQILSGVFAVLGHVFGAVKNGSGGILGLTGGLGDLIVKFDEWLKQGNKLHDFFASLGDILATPLHLIGNLATKLNDIFSGNISGGVAASLASLGTSLKPAERAANAAQNAWDGLLTVLDHVKDALAPVLHAVIDTFSHIGNAIADGLSHNNWDSVFNVIQTGLIAGIFVTLKKSLGSGLSIDLGGGALKKVSESLDVLRGSLLQIQKNIQANTMLQISIAVAALSAAVVALSLVDPKRLSSAMTGVTLGLGQLMGAMALLNKIGSVGGIAKMPVISASLILLAGAIDVLSIAVLAMSRLSWNELAKGLTGVMGLLAGVSLAVRPLSKAVPGMIIAGAGLIAVGAALNVIAVAAKIFATMRWEEIGKGLAGIGASLVVIGLAMKLMPPTMPLTGAGLILVGAGLAAVAGAVAAFGSMDLKTLGKGLLGIGGAMVTIGLAVSLIPLTLPITAAGLLLVGAALTTIAGAVSLMGHMSIGTIVKGIAGIAGSLVVLSVGLNSMITALPGAAALLVASAALAVFVPVLGVLGQMSWGTIAKGLATVAASFLVIGTAGAVAGPAFVTLGAGLALLGAGVAAVGGGVYLLGKGIALLASNGTKGLGVFVAAMTALIVSIPKMVVDFLKGLVQIIAGIADLAPKVVASMVKIIDSLLQVIIEASPKVAIAATALITAIISVLSKNAGPIIAAGWNLLQQLLSGIKNHMGQIVTTVASIVVKFLSTLTSHISQIVSAGTNVLVQLLKGIASNLFRVVTSAASIITKFVDAIANNISKVVSAGADFVAKLVSGIAKNAGKIVSAGISAVLKFLSGIENNMERVVSKGVDLAVRFINAVSKQSLKLVNEGAKAVIRFMNGVADAISKYEPQLIRAGARIGKAIVQGVINGIGDLASSAIHQAEDLGKKVLHGLGKVFHLGSPSKETYKYGGWVVEGLANGMASNIQAYAAAETLGNGVIDKFREVFQIQSPSKVMHDIGQLVGQGFSEGLVGSRDDINQAFTTLNNKITDSMTSLRGTIESQQSHLKKLVNAHKPDTQEIERVREALRENEAALAHLTAGHKELTVGLKKEKHELFGLAKDYADVSKKLDDATQALADATKTRDDAFNSFSNQFSTLPDIQMVDADGNPIDPSSQLGLYLQSLTDQATAVASYQGTLEQLRKLGLDDATYQKLLSDGTVDAEFAKQLLAGGKTAVQGLNTLDSQLQSASANLAKNASRNLYQAGVDAAKGIVDGLQSQQHEIYKQMRKIADGMIRALKKKLHIKSPSREFAKIGRFSSLGLAKGLETSSKIVTSATSSIGDDALMAMRDSMAHISDALSNEMDLDPTITPILDLSQVQAGAKRLSGMTDVAPIAAVASYGQAASISAARIGESGSEDISEVPGQTVLKFEQNNYSPESLSTTEIYRQTNNQLSQAKAALGL